jgi:hypothetical protein
MSLLLLLTPSGDTTAAGLPSVADIGALLHARTYVDGVQLGTFNNDTRPTGEEVERLIDIAANDVGARFGRPIPIEYEEDTKHLVALQAASLVEASYFPDQLDSDQSAYRQYSAMFLSALQGLQSRLSKASRGSVPVGSIFTSATAPLAYDTLKYPGQIP